MLNIITLPYPSIDKTVTVSKTNICVHSPYEPKRSRLTVQKEQLTNLTSEVKHIIQIHIYDITEILLKVALNTTTLALAPLNSH